ncbi:hypothetical protein MN032_17800 [Agromyces atrinae]|uniref:hypothetical protein n=1 Tax=Agromyces atrinae TaxID=592376 RepID=UPI001F590B59|nr:hypothetical protein [Agromyces atrinae]MCI2959543.1 hypothetical protein [Agromyces atrinae]
MSYSTAESDATSAAAAARNAKNFANDSDMQYLATAVEKLSKAVAEIARQHRIKG